MSVVVSRGGKDARRLEPHVFENEEYLQRYVQANPDCIPLHELREGTQLLVLAREFPTDSGSIDALAVDQDGSVYLIETKLFRNTDKRRVIAQVLDYGASLATTYPEKAQFLDLLDARVEKAFQCTAIDSLCGRFKIDDVAAAQLRDGIYDAVVSGRLTFVVLMDRMDERLKDLIKFLNRSSLFTILGVELDFYRYDDLEILIPRLFGGEVRKEVGAITGPPGEPPQRWTEERFLQDVRRRLDAGGIAAVERLLAWSKQQSADIAWGMGKERGSLSVRFPLVSPSKSVYSILSDGTVTVNVGWLTESEAALACARTLAACLRGFGLAEIPEHFEQKYPSVRIETWLGKVEELIGCFQKAVDAALRVAVN
jgi:hypothetical protein